MPFKARMASGEAHATRSKNTQQPSTDGAPRTLDFGHHSKLLRKTVLSPPELAALEFNPSERALDLIDHRGQERARLLARRQPTNRYTAKRPTMIAPRNLDYSQHRFRQRHLTARLSVVNPRRQEDRPHTSATTRSSEPRDELRGNATGQSSTTLTHNPRAALERQVANDHTNSRCRGFQLFYCKATVTGSFGVFGGARPRSIRNQHAQISTFGARNWTAGKRNFG